MVLTVGGLVIAEPAQAAPNPIGAISDTVNNSRKEAVNILNAELNALRGISGENPR